MYHGRYPEASSTLADDGSQLMTMPRITTEQLLAYAAGEPAGAARTEIEMHLREHPDAAALVARYRLVQQRMAKDDSVEPPADVVNRAKAIFREAREPRREAERGPNWLDRLDALIANLLFDSRLQPAGVRSSALLNERVQLAYHAGGEPGVDVDLQAERMDDDDDGPGRWRVMGQLMAETNLVNTPIAFVTPGTTDVVAEARADDSGMFELELPHGTFDLCLGLPAGTVIVPNVELP